jgi:hypothetical protein
MSKFQALKTLLQDAVPAVAKEGEEAVASAIAKETEEKLAEDAAREAFKAEFNLPVAHATSLENIAFQGEIKTYDPKNIRSPFAKFDPAKKDSGDFMAGLGAATLGAGALSSEAKADTGKPSPSFQNIRKQLIDENSPSFGSKTGDFSSYDESEALPTEGMQGRGLATIIRNMVADKKPLGEFEEGGGGIEESTISPIDFISPQMLGSAAKGIGKGAMFAGKEAKALASKLAAEHPELARRLMDNRGELDITPLRNLLSLKNPTKEDVLKAIEYNSSSTYQDFEKEREKLFDALSASAKERAGIPQGTENEEATRQILKLMHPEIEATNLPIEINPNMSSLGRFEFRNFIMFPEVARPSRILLKEAKPNIGLHEAQHFRDMLINPYKRTSEELLGFYPETTINEALGAQRSPYLINKIKTLNPEIKEEEITKRLNEVIKNLNQDTTLTDQEKMIKLGEIVKSLSGNANDLELISARHFHQYPKSFELQKTMELLSPDIPLSTPNLTENDKIIRDIFKQFESETLKKPNITETSKAIEDEYIRQNFPNILEILKNK